MIFGLAIPQTKALYQMIWADPCSDLFFDAYTAGMTWIAMTNALDGAAACGLGFIDYKLVHKNNENLIYAMRKKRLAFAKFSFFMAILTLMLIDKPDKSSLYPLFIGQAYTTMKIGTQIGFNLTPEKFFMARTFLSFYNLAFILCVWYKFRKARNEKLDLELAFF